MPGRDQYSALRSVRRYLGLVLPSPWDVQYVRHEPQLRPLAVVRLVGPRMTSGSAYVRRYTQNVEVFAYPAGVESDVATSEVEAQQVANLILRAFDAGSVPAGGYSLRVPFFDYSAIAPGGVLPGGAKPFDYLVLSNLSGTVRQDPETDDLYTVMVDLRVGWSDDGDTRRFGGRPLTFVPASYQP